MKKTLALTCAFSIISAAAYAEHKPIISIEYASYDVSQQHIDSPFFGRNNRDNLVTFGYGYNFDFEQTFFRPGIYYSANDVSIPDTDGSGDKSIYNPQFSVEADFGVKLNDKFDIFFTAGYAQVNFIREVSNRSTEISQWGLAYGFGTQYNINQNFLISAKYQKWQHEYDTLNNDNTPNPNQYKIHADIIRIGLAYKF